MRLNGDSSRFSIAGNRGAAVQNPPTMLAQQLDARSRSIPSAPLAHSTVAASPCVEPRAAHPRLQSLIEECFRVPLGLLPQTLALKRTAVPDSAPDRRTVNRSCTKLSADAHADPSITSEHPRAQRSFGRNAKSTKKPKHIGNAKHLPRLTPSRGRRQPPAASPDAWRGRMSRKTLPLNVS